MKLGKKLLMGFVAGILVLALGGYSMADHITDVAGLQAMGELANLDKDYILDNDIDASGVTFTPVGTFANRFTGSFDGQGFKITNLYINRPTSMYVGLFGCVLSTKEIKNVRLENCNIIGGCMYIGGLIGFNDGAPVSNCYVHGTMRAADGTDTNAYIGGLIGFNDGVTATITYCRVKGNIITGPVTALGEDTKKLGGLVGEQNGARVSGCSTEVEIVIRETNDSVDWIGGLIGENFFPISDCHATGNITISNCNSVWAIGGLAGQNFPNSDIENCSAIGIITINDAPDGVVQIGGLIGRCDACAVDFSHSLGDIRMLGDSPCADGGIGQFGGLMGYSEASISDCCSAVNITVTGVICKCGSMGGLVGMNDEPAAIARSHALGNITIGDVQGDAWDNAVWSIGGLVGWSDDDTSIADCFAWGNLSFGNIGGDLEEFGGLVGLNDTNVPISRCYSTGHLSFGAVGGVQQDIGGLVGENNGAVTNSFWDTETSGQAASAGGTGKTTEQMQTRSTFTDAGWDFETIWQICESPVYLASYPWLLVDGRCGCGCSTPGKILLPPDDLHCEQKKNPRDVTDPQPEFSAIYRDP